MKHQLKRLFGIMLSLLFMAGSQVTVAFGDTEPVSLKQLRVTDTIYLPTVRSQRVLAFTRPKTWEIQPSSHLHMEFQHSLELVPERSWLAVLVNEQTVYKTPLGKNNAQVTAVDIPLPVAALKDHNTLTFRVEQHYTDRCEDPTDPSLWTQILPSSKIVFDYTPVLPQVDLARYPYPIIDPLTYSPQRIHYVVSNAMSPKELQALGYLNMHLAQSAGFKQTRTSLSLPNDPVSSDSHLVYVGTPNNNPAITQWQGVIASQTGYVANGGQWTNTKTGQFLAGDSGLLLFFPHPSLKGRAVLIVTGNTPDAVLQAAKYITTRPVEMGMKAQAAAVAETWSPAASTSSRVPRFVERETRTFAQLGYGVEAVEKINAPPITYQLPVLADYQNTNAKLFLDLVYSYGSGEGTKLNPRYSSLEIRLNDVAIANTPLLNVDQGENMARTSIYLPKELIRPNNTLVAQFHLLPDKFGFCRGDYDDKSWGKIHDDAKIRVDGSPGSILPNVGVLNYTGFPYSRDDNFKNTHFILPKELTPEAIQAYLGITTRLGRATFADGDLRFSVSQGDEVSYKSKDLIVIQDLNQPIRLPDGSHLSWLTENPILRRFNLQYPGTHDAHKTSVYENGAGTYLEQYLAPWNQQLVITTLSAMTPQGFQSLSRMLEDDDLFAELTPGPMKQLVNLDGSLTSAEGQPVRLEQKPGLSGPANWWNWVQQLSWPAIIAGAVILALLLILLPVIIRRIRYRY